MANKVGGVKQFKPKKNIGKTVGRKISKIFKPSRLLPAYGAYELGDIIYELGGPALSNKMAKELGEDTINTAEDYRNALFKIASTSEGRKDLMSEAGLGIKEELKNMLSFVKPPEFF